MTPEEKEALRLSLVALGEVVRDPKWDSHWGSRVAGVSLNELMRRCGCWSARGCPNMLACKKHPENRTNAVDQWLEEHKETA